jgi:hypothetical protein
MTMTLPPPLSHSSQRDKHCVMQIHDCQVVSFAFEVVGKDLQPLVLNAGRSFVR